jgi:LmbE family N-acetylglucosaminyl deacetylase
MLDELINTQKRILIVGAHPDDAEFSTGRLLLRRKGRNSFVVCMTNGGKGQDGNKFSEEEFAAIRVEESRKALKEFNVAHENIFFLGLEDQNLVSNPFVIDRLFLILRKTNPDFILVPPWEGAHPDHDTAHLFAVIAARNSYKMIEYGSYNNYQGRLRVQEFIPADTSEERLVPSKGEQKRWMNIMRIFRSQKSLREKYLPVSSFENYRLLPDYDYDKLPYSTKEAEIIRDLLGSVYPVARKIIPGKSKLYYETWNNINPKAIKDKLNHYARHYGK